MNILSFIKQTTLLQDNQIKATLGLLEEGATIPFIARYRKERTNGLDEVEIAKIRDEAKSWNDIQARKEFILKSMTEQNVLTSELKQKIETCFVIQTLEDIYLPYKPKRKTKGEVAKQLGLEPLARMIMAQKGGFPELMAEKFLNQNLSAHRREVTELEVALQGAKDIIAEWINENAFVRARLRELFEKNAILTSTLVKGKDEEAKVYKDYFNYEEKLSKSPSHRFLAIHRASKEGFLRMKAQPDKDMALNLINRLVVKGNGLDSDFVSEAGQESYARLLLPSLENEAIAQAKEVADLEAISVFSKNLKQLLLAPPAGGLRTLALDPGFRTGCKVVCLDEYGDLKHNETIYPHPPQNETAKAASKIAQLVEIHKIEAIAIGDGTAGRETEAFIKKIRFNHDLKVFIVREDGASIYSASPIARKEFPDYDITVRGAVSIGRRLMDPLSELVKIEPKSLGVGQYQHDVDQKKLKESLDDVVVSAVNSVGVDLNTASPYLLAYVSGLGPNVAENIVTYRSENGKFSSRAELKKIPRLGDKAFEQCAGFLRIKDAKNILDNTAVHPESYALVKELAKKVNSTVDDLIGNTVLLEQLEKQVQLNFTEKDIVKELKKPGRDNRRAAKVMEFDKNIRTIADLILGMKLPGIVTNVTNFGAFVNIGIKENGLIHKSQLADAYVEIPSDFINLHEHVVVEVINIDSDNKRIGLKRIS
jgi:uncharacterized protein